MQVLFYTLVMILLAITVARLAYTTGRRLDLTARRLLLIAAVLCAICTMTAWLFQEMAGILEYYTGGVLVVSIILWSAAEIRLGDESIRTSSPFW